MTPFDLAQRFIGIKEEPGPVHTPVIQWCLSNVGMGNAAADEVPWCSAFASSIAMMSLVERSTSAAARSWLRVGQVVDLADARPGFDVVILKRGSGPQPGADVIKAPGHVGFFAGLDGDRVQLLAGNQGNQISIAAFPVSQILSVRRLSHVQ